MKKNKSILIAILAFALLLGGAYVLYNKLSGDLPSNQLSTQNSAPAQGDPNAQQTETAEHEKVPAPDFTVYDRQGNAVQLSDYIGRPVVLNFWASWCGPCQHEMPDFNEAYAEQGEDIHFLMVNMTDGSRETVEKASRFIADRGYSFPVFYDTDSDAASAYGVYALPTTIFIDAKGYTVARAAGAIDREALERGIDMIT